ncbi:MAG: sodium:glutamate symporter [Candidatus Marinimicrobia bacterium]|nr:sodium:glutamate symporter [Candidatus Neomarinimicrobiota bacterium]
MITPWDLTANLKDVVLDMAWLSLLLIVGAGLRRYVPFFQRFLVPNNIIAGFVGLIIGPQLLGLADISPERLGMYVYHLLALTFIAFGLRQSKESWGRGPLSMGFAFITTYLIQGAIGLLVALLLIHTFMPDLFAGIGLLVPLGFGMGPGLAYSIGHSWEKFGFEGGGVVGLTLAAIGFLIAYFVGIPLIQRGIRNRETTLIKGLEEIDEAVRRGVLKEPPPYRSAGRLTIASEAMEPMAFQMGLIGTLYLATYAFTFGVTWLMRGTVLERIDFPHIIWSFHFVWAALITMSARKLIDKSGWGYLIDRGLMTRSAGLFMDYLVAASIAAISFNIVWAYRWPLLLMSLLAGLATYAFHRWLMWRAFDDYHFERFIGIFGDLTGTINSGLVLVRITDPHFETPVAEDLVYGSGVALLIGAPLLFVLTLPMTVFNGMFTSQLTGYWITLGILVAYFVVMMAIWRLTGALRFKARRK